MPDAPRAVKPPAPDPAARCPLCVRATPRCRTERTADGATHWCGGALGHMPGYTVVAERDGLTGYALVPVSPLPAPPPAPPFAPPPDDDITAALPPDMRDYLRAAERADGAARRAARCLAAGALGDAERAELDRLEALGAARAARERAALGHLFGARAAADLYPAAGPAAGALAELRADLDAVAEAVARLERGAAARGAA